MKAVLVSLATALVLSCAAPAKPSELPGPANLPTEAQTGDARVELARAREAGDWTAALLALRVLGPKQGRAAEAETIVDGASYQQLEAAMAKMPEPGFPRSRVALRLGLLAQHIGRSEAAIRYLKMVRGSLADRAKAPLARASAELPATNVVAVLLPLSGRYAAVGRELRVAIEIAAAGEDRPLVFLDTAGEAERAAAMVDEAVGKHGAAAILGPVGDRESRAAAARAAELGVVIGLLGPGTDGPSAGVFGLVSSPEWEARAAAKTARLLGYKTAAILAPRDEHGRAAALHFARVAKGLGIRVVADGRYDPTATDLETDLKKFFGLDPKTNARLRRHLRRRGKKGWKSFSPDVAYELLFIPDEYKRAALVASYLPYFNIEVRKRDLMNTYGLRRKHGGRLPSVVQLLGTSGWHHPALIPAGGKAVEGALMIDVYAGGPTEDFALEEAAAFAEAYRRRTRRWPGPLAAQAHDATVLLARAVKAAGNRRDQVARALTRTRLSSAVCGPVRIGPGRQVERQPLVLRVETGEFTVHEY